MLALTDVRSWFPRDVAEDDRLSRDHWNLLDDTVGEVGPETALLGRVGVGIAIAVALAILLSLAGQLSLAGSTAGDAATASIEVNTNDTFFTVARRLGVSGDTRGAVAALERANEGSELVVGGQVEVPAGFAERWATGAGHPGGADAP